MVQRSSTFATSFKPLSFKPLVAVLLSIVLPGQVFAAQADAPPAHPASKSTTPLDSDQRILHLLNRFTFGPTPDDIAAVRKVGVDRWFDQQLAPATLPLTANDSKLNTRLADFPAMQLPVDQLLQIFPNGAGIRQTADGKRPMPDNPYLAAVYLRHIHLYEDKQAKKADAKAKAQAEPATPAMAPATKTEVATTPAQSEMAKPATPQPKPPAPADPARPTYADLLVKSVLALPPNDRVNRILSMQPVEYEQFHSNLKGPLRAQLTQDLTPVQRELIADYDNPSRTVVEELQSQRLLRDIYSSHQLQEVMTTFWLNHFNVYLHKNEEAPYYLVSYERDIIRPRALGNFEDLLVATAESPAMLLYLDNSSSTGPDSVVAEKQKQRAAAGKGGKATPPGLNENYGRELMELHTLGVNGGYTQKDVTEVAKVFTGWTVDKPGQGGSFKFDDTRHQPGKKIVMGHKIKENGMKEGLQLLHILATSPATAHFISQELAVAFVSDTPPPSLVNRMAQTFLARQGDIPSVLRTMVHSPEFWAPDTYQAKVKTPLEYVVSAVRASGADIANTQPLVNALNQMGMPLYACVPPTGYSAKADEWVSTGALVTRMNFGLSLAQNHLPDIRANWNQFLPGASTQPVLQSEPASPADAERILEARLIPTGISDQTRTAVLSQSAEISQKKPPPTPSDPDAQNAAALKAAAATATALDKQNAQLAGLLLGSPEFQRR